LYDPDLYSGVPATGSAKKPSEDRFRVVQSNGRDANVVDGRPWAHVASFSCGEIAPGQLLINRPTGRALFEGLPVPKTVLLRNSTFGYTVAVPKGFVLTETLYPKEGRLESIYTSPAGEKVTVSAKQISWPWRKDGPSVLQEQVVSFRRQGL